jgi:mitogen-activated protein kinase kinase kinase 1
LVHANGSVKLADFGLAKEVTFLASMMLFALLQTTNCLMFNFLAIQMSKINMLRSCKGSVYWMAPEVKLFLSDSNYPILMLFCNIAVVIVGISH